MTKLTQVVHFRGETIPLYATFKNVNATPNAAGSGILNPRVSVRYTNALGIVIEVLPSTEMVKISADRYYYVWKIPDNAMLTNYLVTYTAVVDDVSTFTTEELLIGNPNITYDRCTLRYGPHSNVQRPRDKSCCGKNRCITLPKGEF